MQGRDRALLRRHVDQWTRDGHITPEGAAAIHRGLAEEPDTPALAPALLYGLAGAVLTAAAIALLVFLEVARPTAYGGLAVFGLLATSAGLAALVLGRNAALADGVLVSGVTALAVAAGMAASGSLAPLFSALAVVLAFTLVVMTKERPVVPIVASIAMAFAMPFFAFAIAERAATADPDSYGLAIWLPLAASFLAFLLWRMRSRDWAPLATAITTLSLGVAIVWFATEVIAPGEGWVELLVAIPLALLLLAGTRLQDRGTQITATLGLAIDAVVFAFDVGGLGFGLPVLLFVAGALVAAGLIASRRPGGADDANVR